MFFRKENKFRIENNIRKFEHLETESVRIFRFSGFSVSIFNVNERDILKLLKHLPNNCSFNQFLLISYIHFREIIFNKTNMKQLINLRA